MKRKHSYKQWLPGTEIVQCGGGCDLKVHIHHGKKQGWNKNQETATIASTDSRSGQGGLKMELSKNKEFGGNLEKFRV
eukprot:snap_masked-scaffold_22-processed-gene-3.11-mRNA-1 protein AED:1.00 eAED:1.00 QI:0/0/0/0/1/1/2/0/77